jgi:hypothetical protein
LLLSPFWLVLDLDIREIDLCHRADLVLNFLCGRLARLQLDVCQVVERLVLGQRQLALLVDPLLAFFRLLGGGLPRGRAERAGRQVDAELLRGAEQLVVLLAHLHVRALLGEHVHVEGE